MVTIKASQPISQRQAKQWVEDGLRAGGDVTGASANQWKAAHLDRMMHGATIASKRQKAQSSAIMQAKHANNTDKLVQRSVEAGKRPRAASTRAASRPAR